jgi:hypothetical protein
MSFEEMRKFSSLLIESNMEAPKKRRPSRRVIFALVLIVVVAGASYSLYSAYASPSIKCVFVPGNNLYVHVVTTTPSYSADDLGVKGWLYSLCPIGSSGNSPPKPTSTILGNWNFVTNSTGYVSVPSSDLAGWSFTFNIPYEGHIYQFSSLICGGGNVIVEVKLPAGLVNGTTSGLGESVNDTVHGIQTIQACGVGSWSENATIS